MKIDQLFESTQRRWPKAQGRETPLTKEQCKWFEKFDRSNSRNDYSGKYFWLDDKGRVCFYQTIGIHIDGLKDSHLPLPFEFGEVGGDISFGINTSLTDISFLPESVKTLSFLDAKITSLKGIHKTVKFAKNLYVGSKTKTGLLDLLQVGKIENLYLHNPPVARSWGEIDKDLKKAFKIVQRYHRSNGDIFDCQAELEDAGFGRFC